MGSSWSEVGEKGSLRQGPKAAGAPLDPLPINNTFEPCPEMTMGSLRQGTQGGLDQHFTKARGAARTIEYVFPAPYMYVTSNSAGIDGISRFGLINTMQSTLGQAPAVTTAEVYKGRAAFKIHAPGGVNATFGPIFTIPFLKGGAKQKGDCSCALVKALLAAAPAGGGDLGLAIYDATAAGNLIVGTDPGMLLRPNADNTVTFYAKGSIGALLSYSDPAPIELDVAEYNLYEFRLIGATDTDDAQLRVMINNIEQFVVSFGDVGTLPTGNLTVGIVNRGSGDLWLPVGGGVLALAYDESSLL